MLKKIACFVGIGIVIAAISGCGTMSKMTAGSFYDSPDIEALQLRCDVLEASAKTMSGVATPNANGGTNVVVYTAKDFAGETLAQYTTFRVWIADTQYGAPAAVAGDVAVSGGVEVQQITDKADYVVMTSSTGTVTITVTDDPGRTNFIHSVIGGGAVLPVTMNWNVPE